MPPQKFVQCRARHFHYGAGTLRTRASPRRHAHAARYAANGALRSSVSRAVLSCPCAGSVVPSAFWGCLLCLLLWLRGSRSGSPVCRSLPRLSSFRSPRSAFGRFAASSAFVASAALRGPRSPACFGVFARRGGPSLLCRLPSWLRPAFLRFRSVGSPASRAVSSWPRVSCRSPSAAVASACGLFGVESRGFLPAFGRAFFLCASPARQLRGAFLPPAPPSC